MPAPCAHADVIEFEEDLDAKGDSLFFMSRACLDCRTQVPPYMYQSAMEAQRNPQYVPDFGVLANVPARKVTLEEAYALLGRITRKEAVEIALARQPDDK